MQDESRQEVSHRLSDNELLERGYYRMEQLHAVRAQAERLGRTVTVRAASKENPDEPYVYVMEGGGPGGEAVAYASLDELQAKLGQLEAGAS